MKTQSHIINSVLNSPKVMKLLIAYENSQTVFFLTMAAICCVSGVITSHIFEFCWEIIYGTMGMAWWVRAVFFLMPIILLLITKLVSLIINSLQFVDLFKQKQIFWGTYLITMTTASIAYRIYNYSWNGFIITGFGVSIFISLLILVALDFVPTLAKKFIINKSK